MKKTIIGLLLGSVAYLLPAQINFQAESYYFNDPVGTGVTFSPTVNFGTSLGGNNTVSGDYSVAMGNGSIAAGYASVAAGVHAKANGLWSMAFGSFLETNGQQSYTFGSGDLITPFTNPFDQTFAVGWIPNKPGFVVRKNGTSQDVGIGTFDPKNKLHVMTSDNEGISLMSTATNQRSNLRYLDETGALNWNITAYNDFAGGYGNIMEIYSHQGGNLWVRGTTMMVGDYFDLDGCADCDDFRLFVKKGVRTEQVKVDMSAGKWADYVFEDGYKLLSLEEVKNHIAEEGHLPAMPSAEEVEEHGVNLGDMDAKLLEKIEELTLYIIKQDERISGLESQLKAIDQSQTR